METNSLPAVSVIIPTFNYGRFLGESIQSVLDQTFTDFELIIVDDGSTDNTREVVATFKDPRIRYIYQKNRGLSASRNTGIKTSRGGYLTFHDADDIWLPQNLEIKVKTLDSRPDIALVCSDAYVFDGLTSATISRFWHDEAYSGSFDLQKSVQQPLREVIYLGNFIMYPATLVRRLVFDEVGYFDESLRLFEDWDMSFRILRRFPTIEAIDIPLMRIRRHGTNMTATENANLDRMYYGEIAIIDNAIRNYSLTKAEMEMVKVRIRTRLAPQHLRFGRRALRSGKVAVGRKALMAYIKIKPWNPRPYVHLALSFLGSRGILTARAWKRWVLQHLGRFQTSREAQSINN